MACSDFLSQIQSKRLAKPLGHRRWALPSAFRVSGRAARLLSADTGKAAELGRFLHPFALRHGFVKAPRR